MNIGEKIYKLRVKNNMSQGDLADALDVSRQSISKWETNSSVPQINKLARMCEIFNVTLDELVLGLEQEDFKSEPQDLEIKIRKSNLPVHKIIGIALLSIGFIVFLLFMILIGPLNALIFSSPLLICGIICLIIRNHTIIWCFWALYLLIYAYLRYATGIRFWWIFHKWIYRSGLEIHLLIAWAMTLVLVILMASTVLPFYRKNKNKRNYQK